MNDEKTTPDHSTQPVHFTEDLALHEVRSPDPPHVRSSCLCLCGITEAPFCPELTTGSLRSLRGVGQDAARRTASDRAGGGMRQRRCQLYARAAAFASGPRGPTPCSPRRAGPWSGEDPSSLPRHTASRGACLAPGAECSVLTRVRCNARPVHGVRSGGSYLRQRCTQHLSRCECVRMWVWGGVGDECGCECGWVGE